MNSARTDCTVPKRLLYNKILIGRLKWRWQRSRSRRTSWETVNCIAPNRIHRFCSIKSFPCRSVVIVIVLGRGGEGGCCGWWNYYYFPQRDELHWRTNRLTDWLDRMVFCDAVCVRRCSISALCMSVVWSLLTNCNAIHPFRLHLLLYWLLLMLHCMLLVDLK